MTIANFISELWSAAVQVPFEKTLVFGQPGVVNRNYEGQIRQQGNTVHVSSITRPTIRSYSKATPLTAEELADSGSTLVINQGDYFNFRSQDIDRAQAAGDFNGPATTEAGQGMAEALDTYLGGIMAAGAGNRLGVQSVVASSSGAAYGVLIKLRTALTNAKVPNTGRFVAVSPEFYGALLQDDKFVRVDASGTSDGLRNGIVGRAAGFDVLETNASPSAVRTVTDGVTSGVASKKLTSATAVFSPSDVGAVVSDTSDTNITAGTTIAAYVSPTEITMSANAKASAATGITVTVGTAGSSLVVAGVPTATSLAVQITEMEAMRSEDYFADLVRGLQVYGGKVFRPEGLAVAATVVS